MALFVCKGWDMCMNIFICMYRTSTCVFKSVRRSDISIPCLPVSLFMDFEMRMRSKSRIHLIPRDSLATKSQASSCLHFPALGFQAALLCPTFYAVLGRKTQSSNILCSSGKGNSVLLLAWQHFTYQGFPYLAALFL